MGNKVAPSRRALTCLFPLPVLLLWLDDIRETREKWAWPWSLLIIVYHNKKKATGEAGTIGEIKIDS